MNTFVLREIFRYPVRVLHVCGPCSSRCRTAPRHFEAQKAGRPLLGRELVPGRGGGWRAPRDDTSALVIAGLALRSVAAVRQ